MGYHRAGFEVVGVDILPRPNYPFEFVQGDAMEFLKTNGHKFDVIHASPPCQAYTTLKGLTEKEYPKLIPELRSILKNIGKPWIIENVVGSELIAPIQLCGSSFGLGVRRHRLFEMSHQPALVPMCAHYNQPEPIDVTGTGGFCKKPRTAPGGGLSRKPKNIKEARDAMGIDWLGRRELSQAIPPAFTEWIGHQMQSALRQQLAL